MNSTPSRFVMAALAALLMAGPTPLAAQPADRHAAPGIAVASCASGFHLNQWRRCVPNRFANDASRDAFDPRHIASSGAVGQETPRLHDEDACPPSLHADRSGRCTVQ